MTPDLTEAVFGALVAVVVLWLYLDWRLFQERP